MRSEKRIFVIRGTRAWAAWVKAGHKASLATQRDGKTGWWFESLFPPTPRSGGKVATDAA
jgi:hypothetical protein